jgi:hypothetical protein
VSTAYRDGLFLAVACPFAPCLAPVRVPCRGRGGSRVTHVARRVAAVQRVAEVHYCDACADGEWRVGHGHGWDCPLRKRRHLPRTNEGSSDAER